MTESVDAIVMGMGPGGEAVAGALAGAGLEVVGIESHWVGGECPYYGCIPSKMMIRAADALAEGRRVPQLAGASRIDPDFAPVATRIRQVATTDWNDQIAVDRIAHAVEKFIVALLGQ
ncbi:MAG: FAD-dependent oxidoreductase [Sciscionella sp.]